MTEGQQLRDFIDNQAKSKISIAQGLGVSKQTLFQYFKSRELAEDTKQKVEKYFGKRIFTKSAEGKSVSIDHKQMQGQVKEPLEQAILNLSESDLINARSIERLITLLENKLSGAHTSPYPEPGTPHTETLVPKKKPA